MAFIADILLLAGAVAAAFYCHILGRRLRRFTDLEKGVGGAVAVLSAQVDDLARSLGQAQGHARMSVARLDEVADRAEAAAKRLELLMASLHDLPEPAAAPEPDAPPSPPANPFFVRQPAGAAA